MSKRVNIKLDDKTHMLIKIIASMKDQTLNEYLEKAVEDSLEKDRDILKKLKEDLP
jgi:predicted HicB family RNase H-like nuclease